MSGKDYRLKSLVCFSLKNVDMPNIALKICLEERNFFIQTFYQVKKMLLVIFIVVLSISKKN